MYLIDSNIILELFLDQAKADEVERFLYGVSDESLYISEFSLYSIGIVLLKRKMSKTFIQFVEDFLVNSDVQLVRLLAEDMENLANISQRFNLDFDDAYQYVIAEKYGLIIVSFDADFDRTEHGRKTPIEALKI